jgi:hypothetical protein
MLRINALIEDIRFQAPMMGFVVDKLAMGHVISEYLGFSCQSSFHQLLHIYYSITATTLYNLPQSQSQSYFTAGGLSLISSSYPQVP